jgi:threonine dehydrogenase-like Zn-dependent dehydrogenase
MKTMAGAYLPGNSTTVLREVAIPEPGYGEVLLRMKASTICGSDIRCIYHQHLGKGPEGYQDVIVGHEPCGQVAAIGPGCRKLKEGDRVVVYHISGCGLCRDCRRGYMISCTDPVYRRAYGWQRDGGMADYMLAEEKDLILLPDALSYTDGAQVACGFATSYEGLQKASVSGRDSVLVMGLGPVGLATAALSRKLGAHTIIGVDVVQEKRALAQELNLCDYVLPSGEQTYEELRALTGSAGVDVAVDCSAHPAARALAIRATGKWGRVVFLGEGGTVSFEPSSDLMHEQKTIYGSWVSALWRMEELIDKLISWKLHPDRLVTHRFPLDRVSEAYAVMASGKSGKVAVCFDEELR